MFISSNKQTLQLSPSKPPLTQQSTQILKQKMYLLEQQLGQLQQLKKARQIQSRKSSRSSKIQHQRKQSKSSQQQQSHLGQTMVEIRLSNDLAKSSARTFKNSQVSQLLSQLQIKDKQPQKVMRKLSASRQRQQSNKKDQKRYNLNKTMTLTPQADSLPQLQQKKEKKITLNLMQLKGVHHEVQSKVVDQTVFQAWTEQEKMNMIKEVKQLKDKLKDLQTSRVKQIQDKLNAINKSKQLQDSKNAKSKSTKKVGSIIEFPLQKNQIQESHIGTGKIYNRSRILKPQFKNLKKEKHDSTTYQTSQTLNKTINLKKNANPLAWNPQIALTTKKPQQAIRPTRNTRFFSSIQIQKYPEPISQVQQKKQSRSKPLFHTSQKKFIGQLIKKDKDSSRYESINCDKNDQFKRENEENIQIKVSEPVKQIQAQVQDESHAKEKIQNTNKEIKQESNKLDIKQGQKNEETKANEGSIKQNQQQPPKPAAELIAYKKIKSMKQDQSIPSDFLPNFREHIQQKLISITLPSPPSVHESKSDLESLGKILFSFFDIFVEDEEKASKVKYECTKYKNCVLWRLNEENNIVWYFADGRFYFGGWEISLIGQGKKQGFGYEIVPMSYTYQGFFKNNKRDGYGILYTHFRSNTEQNVIYEGFWQDGIKQGLGYQIQDDLQYIGDYKQGLQSGKCKIKTSNTYYEGYIVESVKSGIGYQMLKNGDEYYGQFKLNMFHGQGQYKWKSGAYFYGQFLDGKRKGQGVWISNINAHNFDLYKGHYEENRKNGYGIYQWTNGTVYEGYFKNDLRHDEGLMKYPNGKAAKFIWKDGHKVKKIYSEEEQNYRRNRNQGQNSGTKFNIESQEQNTELQEGSVSQQNSQDDIGIYKQVMEFLQNSDLHLFKQQTWTQ